MSFKSQLICISFAVSLAVIQSQIGSYPELNADGCGLSRLSSGIDSNCFQWHNNQIPSIRDGRNVTVGEVPWLVSLEVLAVR